MESRFQTACYKDRRVLPYQDIAQPVEVTKPALHFVLEGYSVNLVHRILLAKDALVDDFRSVSQSKRTP